MAKFPNLRELGMRPDWKGFCTETKCSYIFYAVCTVMNYCFTSRAAKATLHASGQPPYVEPCSPGLMDSITSSSARTAET